MAKCSCGGGDCKCAAFNSGKSKSMKPVKMEAARTTTVKPAGRRGGKGRGR